ncbi:uncharacterized protein CANTADRAFT_25029 [Suhomyces tanzawaensis NRRL Y-17324]|uniref:WD-like domain-containing protein n=1 Tax=Suhomyces tanzawaensis NRRL Y-17324 TaxID=984487 RepID=A0A1E4SLZ8_9ASCO|nr:uncharacterized protein CANTADRAFT_25029 [Suhomyces tanzawaensis NRRL Y-17324]ODV80515.1 hypothetical protein CANTADRAFT_25029 [Suhomyces tanzawaensis NRRL Y-17324]
MQLKVLTSILAALALAKADLSGSSVVVPLDDLPSVPNTSDYFEDIGVWSIDNSGSVNDAADKVKAASDAGNNGDLFYYYNLAQYNGQVDSLKFEQGGDLESELAIAVQAHGPGYLQELFNTTTIPELADWLDGYLTGKTELPTPQAEKRAHTSCGGSHVPSSQDCRDLVNKLYNQPLFVPRSPRSICFRSCCVSWSNSFAATGGYLAQNVEACGQSCTYQGKSCEIYDVLFINTHTNICVSNRASGCN